jgi:hypothetical protein
MAWPASQPTCAEVAVTVAVNPYQPTYGHLLEYQITAGHNHGPPPTIDVPRSTLHTYYVLAGDTPVLVHNCGNGTASDVAGGTGPRQTLYHYTTEDGLNGIRSSNELWASTRAANPRDARYGNGQYLSDIVPGTLRPGQLSRAFLGHPFSGRRFTHYVEIDVTGLNVVKGRDGVFVIPNEGPLDILGRIVGWGPN